MTFTFSSCCTYRVCISALELAVLFNCFLYGPFVFTLPLTCSTFLFSKSSKCYILSIFVWPFYVTSFAQVAVVSALSARIGAHVFLGLPTRCFSSLQGCLCILQTLPILLLPRLWQALQNHKMGSEDFSVPLQCLDHRRDSGSRVGLPPDTSGCISALT